MGAHFVGLLAFASSFTVVLVTCTPHLDVAIHKLCEKITSCVSQRWGEIWHLEILSSPRHDGLLLLGTGGNINALWFLHKRSALTNGSRGWIHDEYYSTEWFQLVEWVFLPDCVTEPNFYENTDTHGGLHWQKCNLLLHCGKSLIQRRKRNKLCQKLARDKMKGGVFSAVINKLDLNTTSLWSQY